MISGNYVEMTADQAEMLAAEFDDSWKDPELPDRQYQQAVLVSMAQFKAGRAMGIQSVTSFDAAVYALTYIRSATPTRMLDVGAGSGFYTEVFQIAGVPVEYTGMDYSEAFVEYGKKLYPGIDLQVGDSRELHFPDSSFDLTMSSGCLMHIYEYEKALKELSRVAKQFVLLGRTPVVTTPTRFYKKEAYGVPCLEIHFNEDDLLTLFRKFELRLIKTYDLLIKDSGFGYNYKTFLLEKILPEPYESIKSL